MHLLCLGRCRLRWLLIRHRLRATGSSYWDDFCASVKRSANPSTAGPKRPLGEIRASRKGTLSASLISVSMSHRWRLSTTRLAMDLPIAWAVVLVARSARSVPGQRCAASDSSRGGIFSYPFSSAPSDEGGSTEASGVGGAP